MALQIRVEATDDVSVPVAQAILSIPYYYPDNPKLRCVFLWFLASAPASALAQFGFHTRLATLPSVIDVAIQMSLGNVRTRGRIGLHAALGDTEAESSTLAKRYKDCGLSAVPQHPLRFFRFPFRRQDARLFYLNSSQALPSTQRHNALPIRGQVSILFV